MLFLIEFLILFVLVFVFMFPVFFLTFVCIYFHISINLLSISFYIPMCNIEVMEAVLA